MEIGAAGEQTGQDAPRIRHALRQRDHVFGHAECLIFSSWSIVGSPADAAGAVQNHSKREPRRPDLLPIAGSESLQLVRKGRKTLLID
ncbi:hypothetical protein GCM10010524_14670 [Streptomyces mexicanus]